MQYQIDKFQQSNYALYRYFWYLHALLIYLVFTCRKCGIVNSVLEPEVPNKQALKFCLPKESIIEQLDGG